MNFLAQIVLLLGAFGVSVQAFAVTGRGVSEDVAQLAKASLALVKPLDETLTCSGVLISKTQVITSAHCLDEQEAMTVKFEGFDRIRVVNTIVNPVWIANYPKYREVMQAQREIERAHRRLVRRTAELNLYIDQNERAAAEGKIQREGEILQARARDLVLDARFPGDLAILELEHEVPESIRPMNLDWEFQPSKPVNAEVILAGYGSNSTGKRDVLSLAAASITGVNGDWYTIGGAGQICLGDSGGMTARLVGAELRLIAVNSEVITIEGGNDCVLGQNYGLVTRISDHKAWLRNIIKQ